MSSGFRRFYKIRSNNDGTDKPRLKDNDRMRKRSEYWFITGKLFLNQLRITVEHVEKHTSFLNLYPICFHVHVVVFQARRMVSMAGQVNASFFTIDSRVISWSILVYFNKDKFSTLFWLD